ILAMVIHHIATDGWSNDVLWRELATLYGEGPRAGLAPLRLRYADYARLQNDQGPQRWDADLGYWRRRLAGLARCELPADRERPPVQSGRGAQLDFAIPVQLRGPLLELG